jgi:hypothetical protein
MGQEPDIKRNSEEEPEYEYVSPAPELLSGPSESQVGSGLEGLGGSKEDEGLPASEKDRRPETRTRRVNVLPRQAVPRKREIQTDLPYVTLRNWEDVYERNSSDQPEGSKDPEPSFRHINHIDFLSAVLKRIDTKGRVYRPIWDTGEFESTDPISTKDISRLSPQERRDAQDLLAQKLLDCGRRLLTYRRLYANIDESAAALTSITAYFESSAAIAVAPYRHEPRFLQEVAEEADKAQAEGRPFIAKQLYKDGPIDRDIVMTIVPPNLRAEE